MLLGGKSYAFATQKLCFYTLLIISMLQQYFSKKNHVRENRTIFSHVVSVVLRFLLFGCLVVWLSCCLVVLLLSCLTTLSHGDSAECTTFQAINQTTRQQDNQTTRQQTYE